MAGFGFGLLYRLAAVLVTAHAVFTISKRKMKEQEQKAKEPLPTSV